MHPNFNPIIKIIKDDYEMPQLGRKRRIAALLPSDYETTNNRYPVLYLHDGQNLFDDHAPFGNWGVDHSLANLKAEGFKDVIIIAIDHGHKDRISEYAPFPNARYGEGQGILYLRFMLDTLKPYVDNTFRTLKDGANTGIGGSSMGGLFSLFAGMAKPTIFSKMMIFSPSLWFSPKINQQANQFIPQSSSKLFLYAGGKESENHLPNVQKFYNVLAEKQLTLDKLDLKLSINPEGNHSEHYWGIAFPDALRWLFA